ncbi:MAG: hypothetical protein QOH49_404 [Acidobacteriota bacterium]|jgi:hypothetical protein|nr:hypothetical protein [Acidobacteriota bacterium]
MGIGTNNMRAKTATVTAALLLLLCAAAGAARAQERPRKTHLFLFDVSGSMKMNGYDRYANLNAWLIRPMLESGAFAEGDRVVVRWFHERPAEQVRFDPRDEELKLKLTTYSPQAVLGSVPRSEDAIRSSTNITQALDLALSDIRGYNLNDDVLVWLLTDNFQQSGAASGSGSTDIKPFYQKIDANRDLFRAAYLFPLVNENGAKLVKGREAMILYLLHYSPRPSGLNTNEISAGVSAKIGNPVITWFPIGKNVVPEPVPAEDGETQSNGDTWMLGKVPEGRPLNFGDIRFQLRSKLQSRFLSGDIKPLPNAEVVWPASVVVSAPAGSEPAAADGAQAGPAEGADSMPAAADASSAPVGESAAGATPWLIGITPTRISLAPGEKSKTVYTVNLSNDTVPRAASFWAALTEAESAPVSGVISFSIENITAEVQIDESALKVANADVIRDLVRKSVEQANSQTAAASNRTFSLPIEFRVEYDTTSRYVTIGVAGFGLLALGMAVGIVLLKKTRYELTMPSGPRVLALPLVGREYVSVNGGQRAAVITRRFGAPLIRPLGNYLIDGSSAPRQLTDVGDSFVVESQADGKGYALSWRRHRPEVSVRTRKDVFFD